MRPVRPYFPVAGSLACLLSAFTLHIMYVLMVLHSTAIIDHEVMSSKLCKTSAAVQNPAPGRLFMSLIVLEIATKESAIGSKFPVQINTSSASFCNPSHPVIVVFSSYMWQQTNGHLIYVVRRS